MIEPHDREAVDGAERMHRLIRNLLDFARIDPSGMQLAEVDRGDALDEALRTLAIRAQEQRATITHKDLPRVRANAALLTRLFLNLVGNAIKYTPADGEPQVSIEAQDAGYRWVFTVSDNGLGIDPQDQERIFALFQPLHARDEYPGTGIGLAICKKIVEHDEGRIWVESLVGIGSRFRFTLPKESPLRRGAG